MSRLKSIKSPYDLRKLDIRGLEKLAEEIRRFLLSNVAKTGGHLSSNLGIVELTLALHYCYHSPHDQIVFDTGHQCYVHKIITGRQNQFAQLRMKGGLSGYPKRSESRHDILEPGHSSTSISYALGLAKARDFAKRRHEIVAIIGDGALTAGESYEGLNNLGQENTNITVVLNDNKMSISPNVGALAKHLLRLSEIKVQGQEREKLKTIFENLNFVYLGPIDGHNFSALFAVFNKAKKIAGPKVIHVLTKKGKGFKQAENNSTLYHSTCSFDQEIGIQNHKKTYSNLFDKYLTRLATTDKKIVGITAAMVGAVGLSQFSKKFPARFFDVGIAEQHAVTFAAGLAVGGYRPFFAVYSTFLQRAYDQIIIDVALPRAPVVFMVDRAGVAGLDGPTHEGVFDLSFLRAIPNLTICSPKNEAEFQRLIKTAVGFTKGPLIIRYPKEEIASCRLIKNPPVFPIGKGEKILSGDDLLLITVGPLCRQAERAAAKLKQDGIKTCLLNLRFVKPLDSKLIMNNLKEKILIVEDNVKSGGVAESILSLLANKKKIRNIQLASLGVEDRFVPLASQAELREMYSLTSEGIYQAAKKMFV